MKANIHLNALIAPSTTNAKDARSAKTSANRVKHYYMMAMSILLLGGSGPAAFAESPTAQSVRVSRLSIALSHNLLAEAKPADNSTASDSKDDKDDDKDKDDKKAAKLKKKQEKQAAKDAKDADDAKEAKAKAKKDEKSDKTAAKKDDAKASDKGKKDEKVVEKQKKDEKPAAEAAKGKAAVPEKTAKGDKPAPSGKKESSETVVTKTKSGDADESKKDEGKTADAELQKEVVPTYAPDSALISVLKDLSRSLKDSDEFTKIEDPAQKAIAEIAQQALQKALEDPQLTANRIVEKVGKENLMPPMGTEAWSSGELDLGDKVKASLSVVWAKRENGLLIVTVAGAADKKAPNGKKIGDFVVVLNARSSVESGFDIQSQQNVSFWLGKIASIAVESDCCAPPPAAPAAEGEAGKPSKEVSSDESVKKKSLTILPVLLTNRRSEYLAALIAVEKHNTLVATKLDEENAAKSLAAAAEAPKVDAKPDAKDEATATSQISDLPPGVEAKTMQEAYERALRAVAMKELAKMSPDAEKDKAKAADAKDKDQDKDKEKAGAAKETAAEGATKGAATEGQTAKAGNPVGAAKQPEGATVNPALTDNQGNTNNQSNPATTDAKTAQATQPVNKYPDASGAQQTQPPQNQFPVSQQPAQPTQPVQAVQPAQAPQQPVRQPQAIAVLPSNGGTVINNGPDNVAAFRAVRQPSVGALMMVPERALAGQSMTISIFDAKRNPEASIELSLNGSTMITNIDGQVSFTIPEDATPGRSLNVALAARPEVNPTVIDILQPLIVPSEKQSPSIETATLTGLNNDTLIINGHFFDGIAPNNRITIDGQVQGRIAAASPVELRVSLPVNLPGGDHVITVGCDGLTSNSGSFQTPSSPVVVAPATDRKKSKPPHY